MGKGQPKAIELLMQKNLHDKGLTSWWVFKDLIHDSLEMFAFTERWHWTPEQIRSLNPEDKKVYRLILSGMNRAESEQK